MRTAIYARYSAGPHQTDQSIEGQVRVCTDYCKQHNLTIIEIYADRHISGKTDERPEFQRLIADGKKKKFDAVVVYKTDRFARNKYDSAIYKRQLKLNGIKIFYAAEAIPDGPEGIILESLMEGLAEYYSAELAQKIKRGLHESALKCKIIGNTIPLGYRASKENTFEIDPEGAKTVQSIFEMYNAGETNAAICSRLNSLGIKTSRGNQFNKNSINRIISNEKYIGVYESAGVRIEDGIPPIISKETFYLAQREKERKRVGKSKRQPRAEYLLAGKLYCGHCKKPMIGVSGTGKSGNKFYYYYCQTVRNKGNCDKKHVKTDYIEDLIVKKTVEHLMQPKLLKEAAHRIWLLQSENNTRENDIAYFKKKLQENKRAIDNIVKAVEKGLGTDTLLERLQALESEKTAIEGELAYYKATDFGLSEEQLYYFLESFLKPEDDWVEYKRRIIKCFVNKVFIYNDRLTIYYNINKNTEFDFDDVLIEDIDGVRREPHQLHYIFFTVTF
ncbi:MAG: recombinase family protein [Clostridia bacterium]|nr:recombinase family protein [Clostridia bacterium]